MLAYLRRLYVVERRLSEDGLDRAVELNWITKQQATNLKTERTKAENAENPPAEEPPAEEEPTTEE